LSGIGENGRRRTSRLRPMRGSSREDASSV
jgi:hypothetical protein